MSSSGFNRSVSGVVGGGQAGGAVLLARGNTIIAAGDLVLPPESSGIDEVYVFNVTGSACNLFPDSGSRINAQAQDASVSVASISYRTCFRVLANRWLVV